jgi:hypothetical protein
MGGIGDDDATRRDADAFRVRGNRDRMVGTGKFHGHQPFGQPVVIACGNPSDFE